MRPFFYISIVFISSLTIAIDDDTELPAAELTLVFPAGSTNGTRCSSIPITDDELLEGNHEFTVTLTGAGSHASIDTLSSVTTVTIIDDESESGSLGISKNCHILISFDSRFSYYQFAANICNLR